MANVQESLPLTGDESLVEGVARVVAVEADLVWLEPEQGTSCGGCSSSGCHAKGLGTVASRLSARRFALQGHPELRVGDQVLLGVRGDALLKAAGVAYALPLVVKLAAAGLAQGLAGLDGLTLAASVIGLLVGLALARAWAARLLARGLTRPRFLRRLASGQACRLS